MRVITYFIWVIAIVLAIFVITWFVPQFWGTNEEILFEIEEGSSLTKISKVLQDEGIIWSSWGFRLGSQLQGIINKKFDPCDFQAGWYRLPGNLNWKSIADTLSHGSGRMIEFRIYPGHRIRVIDSGLWGNGLGQRGQFIALCNSLAQEKGKKSLEGYICPGTYYLYADSSRNSMKDFVKTLRSGFYTRVVKTLDHGPLFRKTELDSLVNIASMIQLEANPDSVLEMQRISAIIQNRLKANMPLGIDATSLYQRERDDGIGWYEQLTDSTFWRSTDFNTRRRKGLPPTPIAVVSPEALFAALHPRMEEMKGYYYYFHDSVKVVYYSRNYKSGKNNHLSKLKRVRRGQNVCPGID